MQPLNNPTFSVEFETIDVGTPQPVTPKMGHFVVPVVVAMSVTKTDPYGNTEEYDHSYRLRYLCTATPDAKSRWTIGDTRNSIDQPDDNSDENPYSPDDLLGTLYEFVPDYGTLDSAFHSRVAMTLDFKHREINQLLAFSNSFKKVSDNE